MKYGRLTIVGDKFKKEGNRKYFYNAVCDCGTQVVVDKSNLLNGHTKSCGCLYTEKRNAGMNLKHGMRNHPIYSLWHNMKSRCYNSKREDFHRYGGRGIIVCDEWKNSFESFKHWVLANGWRKGLELERKDNNGIYSPDNCTFIIKAKQSHNRRNNVLNNVRVSVIRKLHDLGLSNSVIANKYFVNIDTIRRVVNNITWTV